MLKIKDLVSGYGSVQILNGANMKVDNQSIVALLGGNGTGKSTILKACSGIIRTWKGSINFNGEDIQNLPPHNIVEKGLVQVTQGKDVFPAMTVLENLRLGGFTLKSKQTLNDNIEKVFNYFPRLNERKNQLAATLSGGELQMLCIGRGLMSNPKMIMLDEPSAALAPQIVMDIFKNIHLKRAIALSIVGRYGEADQEIRFLYSKFKENKLEEMLELTNFLSLPAVQIRIGDKLEQRGKKSYVALYPKPNWLSSNDLIIDEALLWALIRKESSFYLKAKSNRGARGLMQLMPSTARMVMKDRTIRGANRWKLYDLQYNILTGQKLLERLLATENISDSLIAILISWNAGPSRYEQWNKKIGQYKDPLLYIESIPSYETRWFVKEVLKNLWIYRDYLGQEKFSRNQIVQDDWPKYKNLNFKE